MDDNIWAVLRSMRVTVNAKASRYNTDKNYAQDLQASRENGDWRTFYQAVAALELGCGYNYLEKIELLCQKAIDLDARQLLSILEEKPYMIDIVMLLRYVDEKTVLNWIETEAISSADVLFECLRKMLQNRQLSEQAHGIVAAGLVRLSAFSSARFQYLLQNYVLFRDNCILTVRAMFPLLTEDGWSALSACISFGGTDEKHFGFWTKCAADQDWKTIGDHAEPLLQAWHKYLRAASGKDRAWTSLYNEASNLLINVLLNKLDTIEDCVHALEEIVDTTEQAMYCWYETSLQQSDALLAGLSQFEHVRIVCENLEEDDSLLPAALRQRALQLISQWRYLWDSSTSEQVSEEIERLVTWLSVSCP